MAAYNSAPTNSNAKTAPSTSSVQEFSIRVPKSNKKKYQVMRFNANLSIDFNEWKSQGVQVKMERENNLKEFRGTDEETPKFGAGSEYGREAKEEARRRKFGIVNKKYRADDQPWILRIGGKNGKKFKGIREGGVSDNTAYYVFTQAGKGVIEAYPLQEWYKFQPIQRYKALSAEEAEEEFGRRNKIINYFSVMMKKRLRNEEDGPDDQEELDGKKAGGKKKKDKAELKISEMDDWVNSDEDLSGSDDDEKKDGSDEEDGPKSKKKGKDKKKGAVKKKKKKDSDDEAFEESDDGDEEGRELDYISDSSESASDHEMKANKELKGVAEEDALRKLLNSESEDEEEEENKKDENASNTDDEEKKKDGADKEGGEKSKDKSKSSKSKKAKREKRTNTTKKEDDGESSSELSPNSADSDSDAPTATKKKITKGKDAGNSASGSRSSTPVPGEKRKLTPAEAAVAAAKKAKLETSSGGSSNYLLSSSETGVTEDAVRRYLMRKPMTTIELLHKFKSKKTGLSSEQLVNLMTQILKNINPVKQTIKNKMYLSIKPT